MDGSKCILQLRGVRPFLSDKFDITKHKRYKELSDFDKKNEFDVECYLKHELRLLTTEEFDLYIEKAFSHGNPWLMKFRAISIPEKLERTHLKEWLDHVWIVDFEQVEVILQESKWKGFFPEEWLNNGEEDCNGKKE